MHRLIASIQRHLALFAAGLALLATVTARADAPKIQALVKAGDKIGSYTLQKNGILDVQQLSNSGQVVFIANLADGRIGLFEYSPGSLALIAAEGEPSPDGKTWPKGMGFWNASINEMGDIVFVPGLPPDGKPIGVYLWDHQKQQVITVANKGMAAVNGLTFEAAGPDRAAINNKGEVAFIGFVKNGAQDGRGLFVRHADGQIEAIVLPGDPVPGHGGKLIEAHLPSITDAGTVAFSASVTQSRYAETYVWENGTLSVVAEEGSEIPNVGTVVASNNQGGNNQDRSIFVLVFAQQYAGAGLFSWLDDNFTTIAVPGQVMPGGGTYSTYSDGGLGVPNGMGLFPFVARISENGTTTRAGYLTDTAGKLSLVLKTGDTTDLGPITQVNDPSQNLYGISVNDQGQVAIAVKLGSTSAIVLVTPSSP